MKPRCVFSGLLVWVEDENQRSNQEKLKGQKNKKEEDAVKRDGGVPVKSSADNLVLSLIHNHLQDVTPHLAKEFASFHSFHRTELKLKEVVITYKQNIGSNRKEMSSKGKDNDMKMGKIESKDAEIKKRKRECKLNMQKRTRFTVQEDELIRAAMEEVDEDIDYIALAKKMMTRTQRTVRARVQTLKRTGGRRKPKAFTLVEDKIVLEKLIFPRLAGEKLSEIVLHMPQYEELTQQFGISPHGVLQRWQNVLQPWLLQHYSGTLNLRIERMLSNHLADTCTDFSDINWPKVAEKKEFVGHTEASLKQMCSSMVVNAKRKLDLGVKTLSLNHLVDYAEQVYGEGAGTLGAKREDRQRDVIAFFEKNVRELGIKDFL